MSMYVNDAGTLREITEAYVNDNGTLRELESIEVNDAGTLRSFPFSTIVVGSFTISYFYDEGTYYRSYVQSESYGTLSTPNNVPLVSTTGFDKITMINSKQTFNSYGPTSDWKLRIGMDWTSNPVNYGDTHPIDHFKIIGVFANSSNPQTITVQGGYGTSNQYFGNHLSSEVTLPAAFVVGNTYTIEAIYT